MHQAGYALSAQYYDLAYGRDARQGDQAFWLDLARRAGDPVLEVGCGTGRVLLEIARAGVRIDGLDNSPEMLAILRGKLRGEPVELFQADMRDFSLPRKYRLIILPFRPFQHLYTIDDQLQALDNFRDHLEHDGLLGLNVFFPDPRLLEEPVEERLEFEWTDPDDPHVTVRRYFTRLRVNRLEQYFEGEFLYGFYRDEELIREERAPVKLSWYTYPHMQLLFRATGFEVVEEHGSFAKEPISICKEMIFVARKR
jgi:SAM-dependent methyltransferase